MLEDTQKTYPWKLCPLSSVTNLYSHNLFSSLWNSKHKDRKGKEKEKEEVKRR